MTTTLAPALAADVVEYVADLGGVINGGDVECADCGVYLIDVDAGEDAVITAIKQHYGEVHDDFADRFWFA